MIKFPDLLMVKKERFSYNLFHNLDGEIMYKELKSRWITRIHFKEAGSISFFNFCVYLFTSVQPLLQIESFVHCILLAIKLSNFPLDLLSNL
jgi:hypothetical protein